MVYMCVCVEKPREKPIEYAMNIPMDKKQF